jgi:hypothetical protein
LASIGPSLPKRHNSLKATGPRRASAGATGTHDWQNFFEPLGIQISGLVSTQFEPEVCHVWRLIRRMDLCLYKNISETVEITVPEDRATRNILILHVA